MESNLNRPNFTDPVILKLTNSDYWVTSVTNRITRKEIRLRESVIVVYLNIGQPHQINPAFEILFRDKNDNLIGSFLYFIFRQPINTELVLSLKDVLFLSDFGGNKSYLTKSQAIEKLMQHPDIKEWLLWNQP